MDGRGIDHDALLVPVERELRLLTAVVSIYFIFGMR